MLDKTGTLFDMETKSMSKMDQNGCSRSLRDLNCRPMDSHWWIEPRGYESIRDYIVITVRSPASCDNTDPDLRQVYHETQSQSSVISIVSSYPQDIGSFLHQQNVPCPAIGAMASAAEELRAKRASFLSRFDIGFKISKDERLSLIHI